MTLRERVLAVYQGKTPDVVPFMLDLSHWFYHRNQLPWDLSKVYVDPEYQLIDYHKKVGAGFYIPNNSAFFTPENGEDVRTRTFKSEDGKEIIWEVETPLGSIRRKRRWENETHAWAISEWGIQRERDLKVLGYALGSRTFQPHWDRYDAWDDYVGDDGVIYVSNGYSAMGHILNYWLGVERTMYAVVDGRETMHQVVDEINASCLRGIDLLCKSPAEIILLGDNFSSDIQPPISLMNGRSPTTLRLCVGSTPTANS